MRHDDFSKLVDEILQATKDVMISKNAEYAPGDDKLANFKRGAQALGCSPVVSVGLDGEAPHQHSGHSERRCRVHPPAFEGKMW